jgi:thiamine pyridinylase
MYLDALMDEQQNYTDYNELPDTTNLSEKVLALLKIIRRMGGEEQINFKPEDDDEFVRARWFAEGKGRALIAYSEAMSAMGDRVDEVTVRLFSYGTEKNIPLFYTDMVGISSNISEDKKELALELANVLISEEVLTEMSIPENDDDYPQYLLVARKSVYYNGPRESDQG